MPWTELAHPTCRVPTPTPLMQQASCPDIMRVLTYKKLQQTEMATPTSTVRQQTLCSDIMHMFTYRKLGCHEGLRGLTRNDRQLCSVSSKRHPAALIAPFRTRHAASLYWAACYLGFQSESWRMMVSTDGTLVPKPHDLVFISNTPVLQATHKR